MRIGYPCINLTLKRSPNSTFKLKSYSENKLNETIKNNLEHLLNILKFNFTNDILFFRINSDLIPFASHPISKSDGVNSFKSQLTDIGEYIKKNNLRVSMHPSQFVVLNSKHKRIIDNSIKELHCVYFVISPLEILKNAFYYKSLQRYCQFNMVCIKMT